MIFSCESYVVWNVLSLEYKSPFVSSSGMQSGRPDLLPQTDPLAGSSCEFAASNMSNSSQGSAGMTSSPPQRYLLHYLFITFFILMCLSFLFCFCSLFCLYIIFLYIYILSLSSSSLLLKSLSGTVSSLFVKLWLLTYRSVGVEVHKSAVSEHDNSAPHR